MMPDLQVKLNPGLSQQKEYQPEKKIIFTNKLELNLKKKLVNCCTWSIAL